MKKLQGSLSHGNDRNTVISVDICKNNFYNRDSPEVKPCEHQVVEPADDGTTHSVQVEPQPAVDQSAPVEVPMDVILQLPRQVPQGAIRTGSPGALLKEKSQSDPTETNKKKLEENVKRFLERSFGTTPNLTSSTPYINKRPEFDKPVLSSK